ncbi:hypothetical protein Cylst_0994 [Cylindrospermum stagnale PCC 7417]|uniref:Uncharacterized protein n=1 Tax=Cylindrospermum stagnale PCC 7417 TaxID=56107 RepID=K9WU57_9NOST|nr:hypothetical protein [Cylindrospermum stagnale]AFZ23316.1 hypothetical protein Cylst_0994 [Cylindrospermum stagnale PCC 7417]
MVSSNSVKSNVIFTVNPLNTARLRLDKEVEKIRTTLRLSSNAVGKGFIKVILSLVSLIQNLVVRCIDSACSAASPHILGENEILKAANKRWLTNESPGFSQGL